MPITLRVAEHLTARKWTAYRLSKEAHISMNTAYKVSKRRFARLEHRTLERLCAAFNVQPGDLLHWDGKKPWNRH